MVVNVHFPLSTVQSSGNFNIFAELCFRVSLPQQWMINVQCEVVNSRQVKTSQKLQTLSSANFVQRFYCQPQGRRESAVIWFGSIGIYHITADGYLPNFAILFLFSKSSFSYGFYLKNENFVFYLKYKENMCGTWFALQFFQVVIKPRDPVSSSL